jgi:hypothetical protein
MRPTSNEDLADEEFTEAKTLSDYVTCKRGWLDGAKDTKEGLQCIQRVLRDQNTRDMKTWPAHGLLKMLGQDWIENKLVGVLSRLFEQNSGYLQPLSV